MKKVIFSAFTDEYAKDFAGQVECAKRFRLDCMELRNADGVSVANMELPQVKRYAEILRGEGIGVSAVGSPLGKVTLDSNLDAHMETARKIFEFANILGTPNVRMFSFYGPRDIPVTQCREQVVDALGRMLTVAEQFGVTLCHENEARIYGDIPERCLKLVQTLPGLQCVFDMGNFVLEQVEPYGAYQLLKPYVKYFHIKDALSAGAVVPPGKGEAQIEKIITGHTADGAQPTVITLEPHLQTFDGLNALVGRSFDNPYKYPDPQTAFADAVEKLKEMLSL